MRKLFKNSFFSLFSNKFAIITLSIIIFISTATFTLLQTTAQSFNNSWDKTAIKGNLHDFTAKESYAIKGDLNFLYAKENQNASTHSVTIKVTFDSANSTGNYLDYINNYNANANPKPPVDPKQEIDVLISSESEYNQAVQISDDNELIKLPSVKKRVDGVKQNINDYITSNLQSGFLNNVKSNVLIDGTKESALDYRKVQSLSIYFNKNGEQNAFKTVDTGTNPEENKIDKTVLFEGSNVEKSKTVDELSSHLNGIINEYKNGNATEKADWLKKYGLSGVTTDLKFASINTTKGYEVIVNSYIANPLGGAIPQKAFVYADDSAYQSVVSSGYAKEHNISPIDMNLFNQKLATFRQSENETSLSTIDSFLNSEQSNDFKNNIVWVDATPYIVTGIGTTPDFSFPIVDAQNPVPNNQNQAIVFTNQTGYQRMEDAYRTNPTENYLAFKYKDGVSDGQKNNILNKVDSIARQYMNWPSNVRITANYNDTENENYLLAPQRIAFLQTLQSTISTISYVVIISLSVLTGFITIIIVRRQIASKRKILAILLANGYSKTKISGSFMSIGLIVGTIPAVVGYLAGLFLQQPFENIFDNYWTLPLNAINFSWISLVVTAIVPIVTIAALTFVIALWEQRGSITSALSGVDRQSSSFVTSIFMKPFQWTHIRTKLSVSLFSTNLSRMIMIIAASATSIGAASVAITSLNKFSNAQSDTEATTNYRFKVDLTTPTKEGGQYELAVQNDPYATTNKFVATSSNPAFPTSITPEAEKVTKADMQRWKANYAPRVWLGQEGYLNENKESQVSESSFNGNINNEIIHSSYMHLPNASDGALATKWFTSDDATDVAHGLEYLNHKSQTKGLINGTFGLGTLTSKPWDFARSLMPANQANLADKAEIDFFNAMRNDPDVANEFSGETWWPKKAGDVPDPSDVFDNPVLHLVLSQKYINFYNLGVYEKSLNPYFINYNQVFSNTNDEVYTYIKGQLNTKSITNSNVSDQIEVTGIVPNSKYVNLSKEQYKKLANYQFSDDPSNSIPVIPVLVNKYFDEYYNYNVGDTFNLNVANGANRYQGQSKYNQKFKIVGEVNSYAGAKIYTLRNYANVSLGLNAQNGFNGLFSDSENPYALNSINLYSPSGLYPPFDTLVKGDQYSGDLLKKLFNNLEGITNVSDPTNGKVFQNEATVNSLKNILNQANNNTSDAIDSFVNTYSSSIFQSLNSNVEWSDMNSLTFDNLSKLSSILVWMVEGLALIVCFLFIFVTASLLYDSNKRTIAILKVNGYSDREIRRIILKVFLPAVLIGALVAIPFVFLILKVMIVTIITFGKIYIPLTMVGWEIPVATIGIVIAFVICYILSIRSMKNKAMLEAFTVAE